MIPATTSVSEARQRLWDAIVIGGGPAGSAAALGIARRGLRVLLVDRSRFPRHKLCGACLNGDAIAAIQELGLRPSFDQLGGVVIRELQLRAAGRSLSLALPEGIAVTRRRFDGLLVESAVDAGADFLPQVDLKVEAAGPGASYRRLATTDPNVSAEFRARSVVLATGLAADRSNGDAALTVVTRTGSRIGAGTTAKRFPGAYMPGTVFMAIGYNGYVGLTRTEDDSLNIAAALDRRAVRDQGPQGICRRILSTAGFPVSAEMLSGHWSGTGGLMRRRRRPASTRLFAVGDAAGYVEPFTGEGMAWALRGGRAVVPFVEKAVSGWHSAMIDDWTRVWRQRIGHRQRWCRTLAGVLRHPVLVRALLQLLAAVPSLGRAAVRRIHQEHSDELLDPRPGHGGAA